MRDPRDTYRRLKAIATSPEANAHERARAAEACARLVARYGPDVEQLDEPTIHREVQCADSHERNLACWIADYLGIDALKVRNARTIKDRETTWFDGPESVVSYAVELYADHRPRLKQNLEAMVYGYLYGSMPIERPDAPGLRKPTRAEIDAMLTGVRAGEGVPGNRRITQREG